LGRFWIKTSEKKPPKEKKQVRHNVEKKERDEKSKPTIKGNQKRWDDGNRKGGQRNRHSRGKKIPQKGNTLFKRE